MLANQPVRSRSIEVDVTKKRGIAVLKEKAEGFVKAVEGLPIVSMMNILIFLSMGWIFLFLSHYKSRQQQSSAGGG
jgi:hypothetical protein